MSEQEINVLRAEILQDYSEIAAYNRVLYTVIAALLAFAINSDNYLLCLLPYCVMFPIHFMCETRREGICRIGAYLSVFSGSNYQWENRLHSLDKRSWRLLIGKNTGAIRSKIIKSIKRDTMYFQFYLISLLSSAAAIYKVSIYGYSSKGVAIRILVITLITIVSIIIIRKTIVFVPTLRQAYIDGWTVVKEEENTGTYTTEQSIEANRPIGQ